MELCTSELNVDSKSLPEENGSRAAQLLLEEVLKVGHPPCDFYTSYNAIFHKEIFQRSMYILCALSVLIA